MSSSCSFSLSGQGWALAFLPFLIPFFVALVLRVTFASYCRSTSGSTRSVLFKHMIITPFTMYSTRLRSRRHFSSSYLPVAPVSSPPASSRESSRDNDSRRSKNSKSRHSDGINPKRRSTMNSRDAAYDEEDQLRRAIEESKEDNKSVTDETTTGRAKRSRSDSEA